MEEQVSAWLRITDRYLTWIEILDEKKEEEITPLGLEALLAIRQAMSHAPSLLDLANGRIGCIQILHSIREKASSAARPLFEWLDRLMESFARSRWLAGEILGLGERLILDQSATTFPKAAWIAPTTTSWRVRRGLGVSSPSLGVMSRLSIGSP
jgi:hypothetical protein